MSRTPFMLLKREENKVLPTVNPAKDPKKKSYLSIYWRCCHVYSRIYKDPQEKEYVGRCPRCQRFLSVPIGEGGTTQRTFIAD